MIQANLRLVVKIAYFYLGRGLALDDLIGEGTLGLIRATGEYDPRFGTRFSTYASYWIKQSIRHSLINTATAIRLPAHMFRLLTSWRRADRTLRREQGRPASFDEIFSYLGLTQRHKALVNKALRALQVEPESSFGDQNVSWRLDERMDSHPGPDDRIQAQEDYDNLVSRMHRLDETELKVLESRFGLGGRLPLTLREIGKHMGISKEWVRKIEQRAIKKLARVS
jgi:RNA polymerase primary sigma factor